MKVKQLLESKGKNVVSIEMDRSVEDALREMGNKKISALMVTDQARSVGIFTERDVVKCYLTFEGKSFKNINLKDVMTTNLIVAQMDDDLKDIMAVMVEKNIRHLPVVECAVVIAPEGGAACHLACQHARCQRHADDNSHFAPCGF